MLSDELLLKYFIIIWMPFHYFDPGSCIYVASGDILYLRLNRLIEVEYERLSIDKLG